MSNLIQDERNIWDRVVTSTKYPPENKTYVDRLDLIKRLSSLRRKKMVTPNQFVRITDMIISEDIENSTVAEALIVQKEKEVKT